MLRLVSALLLFQFYLHEYVSIQQWREGRRQKGAKEGKWKRHSSHPPPQLHVAPLEPVWPLCTSRSPELGSSRSLHRQSTSGLRCSYHYRCSLLCVASLAILLYLVLWSVPVLCYRLCRCCVSQYTRSHLARISLVRHMKIYFKRSCWIIHEIIFNFVAIILCCVIYVIVIY